MSPMDAIPGGDLEFRIQRIGRRLLRQARAQRAWWTRFMQEDVLLEGLMADPHLRNTALRFVDVLPALEDDRDLAIHLEEYFGNIDLHLPFESLAHWGLRQFRQGMAAHLIAPMVRSLAGRMARRFIAGSDPDSAARPLERLWNRGMGFTLDVLGEAVLSQSESQRYQRHYLQLLRSLAPRVAEWRENSMLDRLSGRRSPRLNLSIKISALDSQIDPLDADRSVEAAKRRLRPVLIEARKSGAFLTLDMESYETKNLILRVFKEVLMEDEFREWPDVGLAMQAYLRETPGDIEDLVAWVKRRGTAVQVRLVRGAYWDYETVIAAQNGWPVPVWLTKPQTDLCYEKCLRMLMENHPHIDTAAGTHNVRSIALAIALAEQHGLDPGQYELQMLYGMADPLKRQLVQMGRRLRIYTPFGQLLPGMAYLVRRLLENTASQSFLSMGFVRNIPEEQLLAPPIAAPEIPAMAANDFDNEPPRRFVAQAERARFAAALDQVRTQLGGRYPLVIGGAERQAAAQFTSVNPASPSQVIGTVAAAGPAEAAQAIAAGVAAFPKWRDTPVADRVAILRRAADQMRERRDELSCWQVLEAGKPWREADGDVIEAIDYLEYYGDQALKLLEPRRVNVPGEHNSHLYEPRGIGAVIAPWNFPLAIPLGMAIGAIITGNCVVLKPAPQTPIIAALFERIMRDSGLPAGVLNYLPGGDEAGEALVADPRVHFIAFTGSRSAGCAINLAAAAVKPGQKHLKYVMAEMGGKNAVIVDRDADLDDAVVGVLRSAFGYAGQKCSAASRVIVVGDKYDTFLRRLVEAAASLRVGPPEDPGSAFGPVIDSETHHRITQTIEQAKKLHRCVLDAPVKFPGEGYYLGPTIFADVPPECDLARQEIFGPVLAVMRAESFDDALRIANATDYALTGGVYSRSPVNLDRARREFAVGNLYLNRKITGANVHRQPFGGFGMSGTDAKAGGPDYLRHFVQGRTVTENTIRRGFAADE